MRNDDLVKPIRIEIPSARSSAPGVAAAAGDIVIAALREAGVNPYNPHVPQNLMVRALLSEWGRGAITRAVFVHSIRNILVLNPSYAQ